MVKILLFSPPHRREVCAQKLGDLRFLLATVKKKQGMRAIQCAHTLLLLFERFQEDDFPGGELEEERMHIIENVKDYTSMILLHN